jgi:hypothetical protein
MQGLGGVKALGGVTNLMIYLGRGRFSICAISSCTLARCAARMAALTLLVGQAGCSHWRSEGTGCWTATGCAAPTMQQQVRNAALTKCS